MELKSSYPKGGPRDTLACMLDRDPDLESATDVHS